MSCPAQSYITIDNIQQHIPIYYFFSDLDATMVKLTSTLLRARIPEYWRRFMDRWMNAQSKPARYVRKGEILTNMYIWIAENPLICNLGVRMYLCSP